MPVKEFVTVPGQLTECDSPWRLVHECINSDGGDFKHFFLWILFFKQ